MSSGCHSAGPGVWAPASLHLLLCAWLGSDGGMGRVLRLRPSSPSCPSSGALTAAFPPDGHRPAECWRQPVTGLNVSQGHVNNSIFWIQALASVLTGPRNKGVWGGRGRTFLSDGGVTSARSGLRPPSPPFSPK